MRWKKGMAAFGAAFCLGLLGLAGMQAKAAAVTGSAPDTINNGVYAETVDLSGMTEEEASAAIRQYVGSLQQINITLVGVQGNQVTVPAGQLGLEWANPHIVEEAAGLGKEGNIVKRYKALKDLENENIVFNVEFSFDDADIRSVLEEQCAHFNVEAVDASLVKDDSGFSVTPGQTGEKVSVDASVTKVKDYLTGFWNKSETLIDLVTVKEEPRGQTDDLMKVKDVLGAFTTSFKSSGKARSANVTNGAKLIDGILLYPGDTFSAYEAVSPFTEENGYYMAGSYLNGLVVDSLGGGICQVSTTLYNAVLHAELEVTERSPHSMLVSYVDPSSDAAIAGTYKDFKFVNSTEYPIYIEGITTDSKDITFTIYGAEYRDTANRKVRYESQVLSVTEPEGEKIVADTSMPAGSISIQSAHKGTVAELWKVVEENGAEVSRTKVNKSTYQMSPRTASVGIATADINVLNALQAAIATGSIDYCKNVVTSLQAAAAAAAAAQLPPAADPNTALPEQVVEEVTPID